MTSALLAPTEGQHEVVNELWFDPLWFGAIAVLVFAAMLAFLWSFRNTLALDPHTEHDSADDGTAQDGHHGPDRGPGPTGGQASQH